MLNQPGKKPGENLCRDTVITLEVKLKASSTPAHQTTDQIMRTLSIKKKKLDLLLNMKLELINNLHGDKIVHITVMSFYRHHGEGPRLHKAPSRTSPAV